MYMAMFKSKHTSTISNDLKLQFIQTRSLNNELLNNLCSELEQSDRENYLIRTQYDDIVYQCANKYEHIEICDTFIGGLSLKILGGSSIGGPWPEIFGAQTKNGA